MAQTQTRPGGAIAALAKAGPATVTSATGASIDLSATNSPGFNPLDLVYAAVAGCLVLSARIAASEMGLLERFVAARANVTGAKASDLPSRIGRLDVTLAVDGDFTEAERTALIARAEALCTVSNTLKQPPTIRHV